MALFQYWIVSICLPGALFDSLKLLRLSSGFSNLGITSLDVSSTDYMVDTEIISIAHAEEVYYFKIPWIKEEAKDY